MDHLKVEHAATERQILKIKVIKEKSLVSILLLSLIMTNLLVATYVHSNKIHLSHTQQNKLVHMLNGNKSSKGYKLSQWNYGRAYLENKMTEIKAAVACIMPSLFCISESNLRDTVDSKIQGVRK